MNKTITSLLCSLLVALLATAAAPFGGGLAQSPTPDAPALVVNDDTPENQITFDQIGAEGDILLLGPYDSRTLSFSLPPEWQPVSGEAALLLELTWTVSSLVPAQGESRVEGLIAGVIEAKLNNTVLQTSVLSGSGSDNLTIPLPDGALSPGVNQLEITWSASTACDFNLSSSLNISPTSKLVIPHTNRALSPQLTSFPAPFYQINAVRPIGVTIVVADAADQAEIEAALTVAAGLGRQTAGSMPLNLTVETSLPETTRDANHLIVVGRWGSLALMDALTLEVTSEQAGEQGIVQVSVSPWNPGRAVLLVSGLDDNATKKAALAVSHGVVLTGNSSGSLALVSDAVASDQNQYLSDKHTLADLGHTDLVFDVPGGSSQFINFSIPPEAAAGTQSFLELRFSHSQLLDYLRSSIVVRLNSTPIGSLRMSDTTAAFSSAQMVIPPAALRPGSNQIEIQADLTARSICSDPRRANTWVAIYPDSSLYLPISSAPASREAAASIWNYPFPFTYSNTLSKTLFVLGTEDHAGWSAAARLAFDLGTHATGEQVSAPSAALGAVDAALLSEFDLFVVGQPNQLELLPTVVEALPVAFGLDNQLIDSIALNIQFDTSDGAATGYLQSGQSTSGRTILAVLGDSQSGLDGAVDALIKGLAVHQGANFAVIQNGIALAEKVSLNDNAASAEESASSAAGDSGDSGGEPLAVEIGSTPNNLPTTAERHAWIIPTLSAAAALFILILVWRLWLVLRNRRR